MKREGIALLVVASLITSLFLKSRYEVDYYLAERAAGASFDIPEMLSSTSLIFEPLGQQGYLGMKDECLVYVGLSHRDGDADAAFERRHQETSQIVYMYKDRLYASPPYLVAQLDRYLQMLLVSVGRAPKINLMLHLALEGSCTQDDFGRLLLPVP